MTARRRLDRSRRLSPLRTPQARATAALAGMPLPPAPGPHPCQVTRDAITVGHRTACQDTVDTIAIHPTPGSAT